jgi:ArsR family transcriptional regulator, virulence genes transcriptional regulator
MAIEPASGKKRVRMQPQMVEVREHATEAAAFLKALANEQRLLVLCTLLGGALSVGEINEQVPLSQSALSQHLSVLRDAGLVTTARQAQTIRYAVAPGPALKIMEVLYSRFCDPLGSGARSKKATCTSAAGR